MTNVILILLALGNMCTGACVVNELEMTLPQMVSNLAVERGVDVSRALTTVRLESSWDPEAVGDDGMAVGLWQFHSRTWRWGCDLTGYSEWRDLTNRVDPVKSSIVALDMIALGYGHHWVGWRRAGPTSPPEPVRLASTCYIETAGDRPTDVGLWRWTRHLPK